MEVDHAYMMGMLKVEDETYSCIQIEIGNMEMAQNLMKKIHIFPVPSFGISYQGMKKIGNRYVITAFSVLYGKLVHVNPKLWIQVQAFIMRLNFLH